MDRFFDLRLAFLVLLAVQLVSVARSSCLGASPAHSRFAAGYLVVTFSGGATVVAQSPAAQ